METLHDEFMPLIARPFSNNSSYKEILPDETLRPFIRCFWAEDYSKKNDEHKFCNLIIPDVCMDIITAFDKKNEICFSAFCTVDKKSYYLSDDIVNSNNVLFGIRFYAWTANFFASKKMNGINCRTLNTEEYYPDVYSELILSFKNAKSFEEMVKLSNSYFLNRLQTARIDFELMRVCSDMVRSRGIFNMKEAACSVQKSERQLERLFKESIGVSPKTLASLIRYQSLWNDILNNPESNVQNLVDKYSYFDQSHMLNDFKKRHGMSIKEALDYAKSIYSD